MDEHSSSGLPTVGDRVWANVSSEGRNLRLFASVTQTGWEASVYDLGSEDWVAREWADSEEDGMRRAEALARAILRVIPPLD